ncbi:conserved hypothetical protein [Magnetospirillum sp. LM-5]|nr:conserved hypothetical protein [Magnetospirillum sp. LM-5]
MVMSLLKRLLGGDRKVTYEEARDLAADPDPAVRSKLAGHPEMRAEILYFLAEDSDPDVRRLVAANPGTPAQANLLLARDIDAAVRQDLAMKIARVARGLTAQEQDRLRRAAYEALETLARDQITRVREILSQALKDVADAPPEVIGRLARDAEIAVAGPVLQYSPVLTDEDLLEIIASSPIPGALTAISKRDGVNVRVADAIAATDDTDAIAVLLGNASAQIREETLDRLVDRAVDIEAWHQPLVNRPSLPSKAAIKLARFVAANLLQGLALRNDLDTAATAAVAAAVRKRLDELEVQGPAKGEAKRAADEEAALIRARHLHAQHQLNESTIDTALSGNDIAFVTASLAVLAELSPKVIKKTVETQSAKGMVSIAWKAGLSMSLCMTLQSRLLKLPASRTLHARDGGFPLSPDEMTWQLEFLAD